MPRGARQRNTKSSVCKDDSKVEPPTNFAVSFHARYVVAVGFVVVNIAVLSLWLQYPSIAGVATASSEEPGIAASSLELGDCVVLKDDAGKGGWQDAMAAGLPVIARLSELVAFDGAPLDYWKIFPDESVFDFSISPIDAFYYQVVDPNSSIGLRRNCPARMEGANWSLVQDIMTYLVQKSKLPDTELPESLQRVTLKNVHDPLSDGPVPLRHAIGNKYRMYLSGESNTEMHAPQSMALRAIMEKVRNVMAPRDLEIMNAWVSAGETVSNLHFDGGDNWLCQLSGTKIATMFSHNDRDFLYPIKYGAVKDADYEHVLRPNGELPVVLKPSDRRDEKTYAAVNENAPDMQRFPDFTKARRQVCRIHAGQCLGIPHHYWHNIKSDAGEINFSLNFGFGRSKPNKKGKVPEVFADMELWKSERFARWHLEETRSLVRGG